MQKPLKFFLDKRDKFENHDEASGVQITLDKDGKPIEKYLSSDYRNYFNLVTHRSSSRHIFTNFPAIIKNKGTPNLLKSSVNIDGTQTFLTQLSAVNLKSIEKRGKIQTTKMNKFSNLNICSTKREPNPQ